MNLHILRLLHRADPIATTMAAGIGSLDGVTTRGAVHVTVTGRTTWGDFKFRMVCACRSLGRLLLSTRSTKSLALVLAGNPE